MNSYYLFADYDFKANAIGIGINHPNINVFIKTDSLDFDQAEYIELALSVNYTF